MQSLTKTLRSEGVIGFIIFLIFCSIVWMAFLSLQWGIHFVPQLALDDDTMHKTVIYYMLQGEDFYSAWRHAAQVTGDLGDLRIYRTPLIFYLAIFITGWAGPLFVFPLSVLCVFIAAFNLLLSFWTVRAITGSGWAGLAATFVQYAFFFNVIPLFQISLFAMPFIILTVYWAWTERPWLAGVFLALAFLIKETFAFALPAILVFFLLRREWRQTLIILSIFMGAVALYFIHTLVAQPILDPQMMLTASIPEFLQNLGGFLWFGFGVLYYNVLAPATFNGYYTSNPLPAFLPIPLFYAILVMQVFLIWGTIIGAILKYYKTRQAPPWPLVALAISLWIAPILFTATTNIDNFVIYWIDYAIWRWFGASYVGFQILVGLSWTDIRQRVKDKLANPSQFNIPDFL